MTEEKQEKILYMCTCGKDRSEMAHIPFVLANAALAMDITSNHRSAGRRCSHRYSGIC